MSRFSPPVFLFDCFWEGVFLMKVVLFIARIRRFK